MGEAQAMAGISATMAHASHDQHRQAPVKVRRLRPWLRPWQQWEGAQAQAMAGTFAPTASRILSSALKSTSLSAAPLAL